jgi:putative FmdB family regulatory protein
MPIYEYYCPACNQRFEKLLRMSAAGQPQACPNCANPAPAAVTRPARITGAVEGDIGSDGDDAGFGADDGGDLGGHGHSHGHSHGPGGHMH